MIRLGAMRPVWLGVLCPVLLTLAEPIPSGAGTLTILHSSEHHGHALPIEKPSESVVGGLSRRGTLINQIRQESGAVLLVDSGDILVGTAFSSFFRGEPDIEAMNLLGYQAMATGNHEFDFGLDHLRALQARARFPFLCSNLASATAELPCEAWAIVRVGEITIGILGLVGRINFPDAFNQQVARLLELRDPIETARALARTLKSEHGVGIVMAITHEETAEDLALLESAPEIDIIIGGHTNGFDGLRTPGRPELESQRDDPRRVFVKTHQYGVTLGRLDVLVDSPPNGTASIRSAHADNIPVTGATAPHPEVETLLARYRERLEAEGRRVLGNSRERLEGESTIIRTRETSLGNLLADVLRREFGTDVAFINAGQIRDSIPPGPVDVARLMRVLPFDSSTVTLTISGRMLKDVLENSIRLYPSAAGRFLHVSGLTVVYDTDAPSGARVKAVSVQGRPLDPDRWYTAATDAFLADGGDGYRMLVGAKDRIERQLPLRDLLIATLRAGPLHATVDGRTRIIADRPPAHAP